MGSEIEAKSICVHKLEDLLLDPMFTIFQVQHAQIASKTETKNTLIYHLKCSMTKVRTWNSTTVRDFCSNLMTRFPALDESFILLFRELQELTCKILNQSSESSAYSPIREEVHTYLHSFISACSDAFISHIQWFAVEESSTEYQSCKNNAKVRMQQAKVVENTVMNFVRAGPKEVVETVFDRDGPKEVVEKVSDKDDQSKGSLDGETSESDPEDDFVSDDSSDDSSHSRTLGNKSIDLISGAVKDGEDQGPQFSTPFAKQKKQKSKRFNKVDSESDSDLLLSSSSDRSSSDSDSSDDSSDDSDDSSDDSSEDYSDDSSSDGSADSSDDSSDDSSADSSAGSSDSGYSYDEFCSEDSLSSFDTDFDCESSSSSGTDTDTEGSGSEGSDSSISAGEISSESSVSGDDKAASMSSDMLLDHILNLKRKENRHREKQRKKEKF